MSNAKKLYRSKTNRVIFGVCGGLGEYFETDPLIVRILFVVLSLLNGAGIIAYLILAVVVPEDDKEKKVKKNGNTVEEVQEKTQELAEELKSGNWLQSAKNIFGLIIVLIGLNVLFEQVFQYSPFAWINWGIVWGLIIILIGSRIIFGSNKK
ncbi:MAG: PspC domain-containing protein [Candidatus Paceibacterota bacterium]|jgi:phage shock protein PspC (stress-responsive transcriptional regulator)